MSKPIPITIMFETPDCVKDGYIHGEFNVECLMGLGSTKSLIWHRLLQKCKKGKRKFYPNKKLRPTFNFQLVETTNAPILEFFQDWSKLLIETKKESV